MKYIIGIDEVGRGPLAGPVTVCAVLCEENLYKKLKKDKTLPKIGRDSKKLSPELRQKYSNYLKNLVQGLTLHEFEMSKMPFDIAVVHISNKIIDNKGISFAIKSAIKKCLKNLDIGNLLKTPTFQSGSRPKASALKIILDGGLKAPAEFKNQKTIIKGDEKEKIIAWSSILAKVSRDHLMIKMHKKYPKYGLDLHKGYGTKLHIENIRKNGLSEIHRKSFCKRFL